MPKKTKKKTSKQKGPKQKIVRQEGRDENLAIYRYIEERAKMISNEVFHLISNSSVDGGGIIFVHGPLYSGKTIVGIYLSRKIKKEKKLKIACVQPKLDRKDVVEGYLYTRKTLKEKALSFSSRKDIENMFDEYDVIIADEVCFIPYELQSLFLREIDDFVDRGGWFVGLSLLYSSQRTEFLLPAMIRNRALRAYRLIATCQKCGRHGADREQRLVDGKPAVASDPELAPPSDKVVYEARCKECHVLYS